MSKQRYLMAVAAHLVLQNDGGEVLFLRRANTGYADGQWSIPAGHVEQGETLAHACCREVSEETGIELDATDVACVLVQHKHDLDGEERIDVFFSAGLPKGQSPEIREPHCCDALRWADLSRPPEPTVAYVAHALGVLSRSNHPIVEYFGFSAASLETDCRRAHIAGCERMELDSGTANEDAHRVYERHGMNAMALHFGKDIT